MLKWDSIDRSNCLITYVVGISLRIRKWFDFGYRGATGKLSWFNWNVLIIDVLRTPPVSCYSMLSWTMVDLTVTPRHIVQPVHLIVHLMRHFSILGLRNSKLMLFLSLSDCRRNFQISDATLSTCPHLQLCPWYVKLNLQVSIWPWRHVSTICAWLRRWFHQDVQNSSAVLPYEIHSTEIYCGMHFKTEQLIVSCRIIALVLLNWRV